MDRLPETPENRRPSLMVVDDEEPLLQIFQEFFEGLEYELKIARSAEEAIALLQANSFELIVTDLNLPGADGLAVLRAAKQKDSDTEVIVLTGNASTLTAIDAMRQGAYDYVLKPFDLYEMDRTIQKALERRRLLDENRRFVTGMQAANEELRQSQEVLARHRDELERAVHEATKRIRTLYEVGKEITSSLHLEGTLQLILDRSVTLIGAARGLLYLFDDATGQLGLMADHGLRADRELEAPFLTAAVGANERALAFRAPRQEKLEGAAGAGSLLVVPLFQNGEPFGTVVVAGSKDLFSEDDQELLVSLASQASIAINNARVFGKIRDLDTLKSEFVAVVSHEVRTPLTAIKGTLEILGDQKYFEFSENQRELLEICSTNVARLEVLINDILDFSKLESSRLSTHFTPTDLAGLIDNAVLNIGAMAERKRIQLKPEVAPNLPEVVADELRIIQVLNNLVSNAIKFSPEDSVIRIRATLEQEGVTVRIQDSGIGIAPEDLSKLFRKFRQLDSSSTRKAGGTGLGLVISKGIVEEHGGKIWVESTVGEGSTFSFWLPIKPPAAVTAAAEADAGARTPERAGVGGRG